MGSEYKFIIIDSATRTLKCFETGENRLMPTSQSDSAIVRGLRLSDERERWRGAGVAIPVFSLRSDEDWGVGEFCFEESGVLKSPTIIVLLLISHFMAVNICLVF